MRNNVNRNIASSERDSAVIKMQVEIKAGLYHCLKISNQEKHKYCPVNSWCKFKKGLPCPNLDGVFKEPLEKIYDRLSEPALLIRCLPGYTQNASESVNALAWNKCPKHKWHERNKIVMAASPAALHFSCGATKKFDVMRKAEISPGKHSWKEARRRDSGRILQAEHRAQEKHKQYRLVRRQAKQRGDLRVNREGITYEAGGLDETQQCKVGKKRRTKEPKHTFK